MKFSLIVFAFLGHYVSSVFEKNFDERKSWEESELPIMHDKNWKKYHPVTRKQSHQGNNPFSQS